MEFSKYKLGKWSRLCRIRDEFKCLMCNDTPERRRLQCHHIMPKSLFPELAYELSNGISLCVRCHICVCHASTTFDLGNYKIFVPTFRRLMRLSKARKWNEKYQHKLN